MGSVHKAAQDLGSAVLCYVIGEIVMLKTL